jgi:hypothetical protein
MGASTSGNRTGRRGRRLILRLTISKEAASALRALTAADQTTDSEVEVVNRLILAAWHEFDNEIRAAADAAQEGEE